jgi:RNA polymerase sigma-B factor
MTHAPVLPQHTTATQASLARLFVRWQQDGDAAARDLLVQRYTPLVIKLARRYHGAHEPLDDLKQVASLGLIKAIDRFDSSRGITFQSFAVPTILGELKRYFRDCGWAVHVPRGLQERSFKVEQARRKLAADNGRSPTFPELAEYLEISLEEVLEAVEAAGAHHAVSFDTPHDDGEGDQGTLGDSLGKSDAGFDRADLAASIKQASSCLSEREREVLALRFVADQTQSQIANQIGVSQMQVSRILRSSLDRLSAQVA